MPLHGWTPVDYARLDQLAPDWTEAARVLQRSPLACKRRWYARHPLATRRTAIPPSDDRRGLLALLVLGRAAGLTVGQTIEYFHRLSRHSESAWREDARFLMTDHWAG